MSDPTKGSDYLITVIKNADHTIERLERALAAAEARIEAVLTLQDEYEKRGYLLGGTIAEIRAALTREVVPGVPGDAHEQWLADHINQRDTASGAPRSLP